MEKLETTPELTDESMSKNISLKSEQVQLSYNATVYNEGMGAKLAVKVDNIGNLTDENRT